MRNTTEELVKICRLFGSFERDTICCGSVTVPQCATLQELLAGPRDVSSLAESARVTKSAMTRLLDGLVKKEFVERTRDQSDRRRVLVSLSREGKKEAQRLREMTSCSIDAVLARVPEDKRAMVIESIALIREALENTRPDEIKCC